MGTVTNIADYRKVVSLKPTLEQLIERATDEIKEQWQKFACNNRLNDYFLQRTSPWSQASTNYLENLNAVAVLEQKVKLEVQVVAPGFGYQIGWVAAFRLNGILIVTPFMPSEAYARCFNILLFLKLWRELQQHDIPVG